MFSLCLWVLGWVLRLPPTVPKTCMWGKLGTPSFQCGPTINWWFLYYTANPKTAGMSASKPHDPECRRSGYRKWINDMNIRTYPKFWLSVFAYPKQGPSGLAVWTWWGEEPKQGRQNIANKCVSLLLVRRHQPEQHDVSRRAPAGWNEGPHDGQGHVEFKDVVAAVLPGTLTQRSGHVHAGQHPLLDAGAVVKRLMRQTWQPMFGHQSWGKFRKTALCLGFEAIFFFFSFFLVFLTCGDIRYLHIVSAEDQLIKFGEKSSSLWMTSAF